METKSIRSAESNDLCGGNRITLFRFYCRISEDQLKASNLVEYCGSRARSTRSRSNTITIEWTCPSCLTLTVHSSSFLQHFQVLPLRLPVYWPCDQAGVTTSSAYYHSDDVETIEAFRSMSAIRQPSSGKAIRFVCPCYTNVTPIQARIGNYIDRCGSHVRWRGPPGV